MVEDDGANLMGVRVGQAVVGRLPRTDQARQSEDRTPLALARRVWPDPRQRGLDKGLLARQCQACLNDRVDGVGREVQLATGVLQLSSKVRGLRD